MKERKKNSLKSFDYLRSGCYFITICTNKKQNFFGKIEEGILILNDYGRIAMKLWAGLPKVFKNISLDIFVIMPNHLHGIIAITEGLKEPVNVGKMYLSKVIQTYKAETTRRVKRE